MNSDTLNLTTLTGLEKDEVFSAFTDVANNVEGGFNRLLRALFEHGAECDLTGYICGLILEDVNAFSKTCSNGKRPSPYLTAAYEDDLNKIFNALDSTDDKGKFCKGKAAAPLFDSSDVKKTVFSLEKFYKKYGFGKFIKYRAFSYSDGDLIPIKNTSPVTLDELKNYEYEKKVTGDNIYSFLQGLPYSNMLLYGDRGTGKSSTVHALLNKFFDDGLRLIELSKENILAIPKIRELIADNPLKFIIFIDDLSFGEYDENLSSLKASLEGSVSGGSGNVMIVATSNRRHIVKENFSDRENSVHPSDSLAEQLSLSDRFGLTVMFSTTDKAQYLSIVMQLASDKKLTTDSEKLCTLAEKWALVKGGRSPRRAKQFIDLIYSCEKTGRNIDF